MISVITPTYNRGYIIGDLFTSLLKQSCLDFEWLIIDDGSTDDTKNLIGTWSAPFPIRYYYKDNGGKHRALNYGIPKALGDYLFIVDSDDYLSEKAIQRAYYWIASIRNNQKFAGVAGLRGWKDKEGIIGDFPKNKEYYDCSNSHRYMHHLKGDKAEIYRKDILLQFPFPEFEGEKFLGEGAVWNAISKQGYIIRWFNEVIYYCDYLPDGLTNHQTDLYKNNFKGYTYNTALNYQTLPFPYNLMAVSMYLHIAQEIGIDDMRAKESIGLGYVEAFLCRVIRRMRHI